MFVKPKVTNQGITLVEVLVGVSLVVVVAIFVGIAVTQFASARNSILNDTKKAYLAEEGYEVIRFLRDEDWANISGISLNTPQHLDISTTTLSIVTTPELIEGKYYRNFILQAVYRNGAGNVVNSSTPGASLDSNAKKVIISVGDSIGTTSLQAILTNLP